MSELKPCPFCGPESEHDCSCEIHISVVKWNTRPIEDALAKRIAELEDKGRFARRGDFDDDRTRLELRHRIAELEAALKWRTDEPPKDRAFLAKRDDAVWVVRWREGWGFVSVPGKYCCEVTEWMEIPGGGHE